jgi:hypothetical protein
VNIKILYSSSPGLRDIICSTAARMVKRVERPIELVEYIILPDFGQRIILRFGPASGLKLSFAEADALESALRRLACPEYWVTLTGDSYQNALPDLGQRLINIDQKISADVLQYPPTRHSEPIRADAQTIRGVLNLTGADRIWEIEVPILENTNEPIIRIIGAPQEREWAQPASEHVKVGGIDCAVEYMSDDPSFAGCVKAYIMAERQQMALTSYIAQEDFTA